MGIETLQYQLMDLNLNDKPNIVSRFVEMFRSMWVNNGNELSKMYAGTGALGNSGSKVTKLKRKTLYSIALTNLIYPMYVYNSMSFNI